MTIEETQQELEKIISGEEIKLVDSLILEVETTISDGLI